MLVVLLVQNCTCFSGYTLDKGNGTPSCTPSLVPSHVSISITVLVVVPALVIVFLLLDAIGRFRRGSYERYVLRWVRRRGPPGQLLCSHAKNHKHLLCHRDKHDFSAKSLQGIW